MSSDSKFSTVAVKLNAYNAGHTLGTVTIDGVPVKGVRHINIDAGHNQVTEVTITMMAAVDVEIDGARVLDSD